MIKKILFYKMFTLPKGWQVLSVFLNKYFIVKKWKLQNLLMLWIVELGLPPAS